MGQQNLDTGTRGNNLTGDDLNAAAVKIEANFTELYTTKLNSIVGGTNATIDNTDPLNPIINVTVPSTITNTSDLVNDGADGTSTYVENDEIGALAALNTVDSTEINNAAVTLAKMANANAFSIIGNNTASPATPLYLTTAQVRNLLNVEDGAAANQTLSIVGDQLTISGTGGNTITIPTGGSVVVDSVIIDGSTNPVQNNAIHDALADINSFVSVGNIAADKLIDGIGSGLDADLLDGLQSTQFLRSDTSDTFTGTLNLSPGSFLGIGNASTLFDIGAGAHTRWTLENGNLYINDNILGDFVTFNSTSGKVFFQQDIEVQDDIYDISWNGSLEVPTKNAIYDKIETLSAPNLATVLLSGNSAGASAINMSGQNIISAGNISATSGNITTITSSTVSVNDQAYSTLWNGALSVPTKNAVYDKIQSISLQNILTTGNTSTTDIVMAGGDIRSTALDDIGTIADEFNRINARYYRIITNGGGNIYNWELNSDANGDVELQVETTGGSGTFNGFQYKFDRLGTPTDSNHVITKGYADANYVGGGLPYTSYAVKVSQSGTANPSIVTTFNNDTGLTWTWTRTAVGVYRATPSGGLNPDTSCMTFAEIDRGTAQDETLRITHTTTYIQIATKNSGGSLADTLLNARLEIRVY